MSDYTIILFYKFFKIDNPHDFCERERLRCQKYNLKGRFLVATEGVNSTLEGNTEDIEAYINDMHATEEFFDVKFKKSRGIGNAFSKLTVKVRPEVITLEAGEFDIQAETAPELSAIELQKMYENDEDFVVLDLRNDFEVAVGYFDKTVDPKLEKFKDLPEKLQELEHLKNKKIVTVCTGGIRCEKATCLMKREGFKDIYQLKDGIHTYMEQYPGKNFRGTLFVFDNRMVSDVVDTTTREIVGKCAFCSSSCETIYSDDNFKPSKKVVCCDNCYATDKYALRKCI